MQKSNLLTIKKKMTGRDSTGTISVRHKGGEHKRYLRTIDWKREHKGIQAKVCAIEYDPNRTANIALLTYVNGAKAYILAPENLKIGDTVLASENAPIQPGNALPLKNIPSGVPVHAIESIPGAGASLIRSAGSSAYIQSIEGERAILKLPSGEIKLFPSSAWATIGQVGNSSWAKINVGKAGTKRRMGIRPTVRGVAQHPNSHPHGGGEGRSRVGLKYPKTPWGKPAVGKTRKAKKSSNRLIIKRRK